MWGRRKSMYRWEWSMVEDHYSRWIRLMIGWLCGQKGTELREMCGRTRAMERSVFINRFLSYEHYETVMAWVKFVYRSTWIVLHSSYTFHCHGAPGVSTTPPLSFPLVAPSALLLVKSGTNRDCFHSNDLTLFCYWQRNLVTFRLIQHRQIALTRAHLVMITRWNGNPPGWTAFHGTAMWDRPSCWWWK